MRALDDDAIAEAAARRFRSEYDYAVWEYRRSAKVIRAVERAGVVLHGRVLDAGCGGGGTVLSLAEEVTFAVGLDLDARFRGTGTRLRQERRIERAAFVQGDALTLPFRDAAFDLVFSHSVIEHVASAEEYLSECRRVLRRGGLLYLSTAPHASFAGAHLPRLRLPIPIHVLVGRRAAFSTFKWLAAKAPWTLREPKESNTFIALAEAGQDKHDDLLQKVTLPAFTRWLAQSGFVVVREDRYLTGFFRSLPTRLRDRLLGTRGIQDVMVGQIECVLRKP